MKCQIAMQDRSQAHGFDLFLPHFKFRRRGRNVIRFLKFNELSFVPVFYKRNKLLK